MTSQKYTFMKGIKQHSYDKYLSDRLKEKIPYSELLVVLMFAKV